MVPRGAAVRTGWGCPPEAVRGATGRRGRSGLRHTGRGPHRTLAPFTMIWRPKAMTGGGSGPIFGILNGQCGHPARNPQHRGCMSLRRQWLELGQFCRETASKQTERAKLKDIRMQRRPRPQARNFNALPSRRHQEAVCVWCAPWPIRSMFRRRGSTSASPTRFLLPPDLVPVGRGGNGRRASPAIGLPHGRVGHPMYLTQRHW